MACIVENCTEPATVGIDVASLVGKDPEDIGPWSVPACEFHAQALLGGEAFSETEDGKFRIGTHGAPPRLLNMILTSSGLAYPELTLELGHDGIVDQRVTIQISEELEDQIFMRDSILSAEMDRNRREDS